MPMQDFGSIVDLEEKAVSESDDIWTVTGYGSVFSNTDLGNDVVMPGAFAKSLRTRGLPLLLFNHKMEDAPIGTIVDAKEDKRGLWFKAELPKDDTFVAGRIVPQLKKRGLRGTSIGYKATSKEIRKADGARLLKEISLYEISIVNMPMNEQAGISSIKGVVPFLDLPIDTRARKWDAGAALKRLRAKFGGENGPSEEYRSAFLYVDEAKGTDNWDAYCLPIADVDENGCVKANPHALYKAAAALSGARGGVKLAEEVEDAVSACIDRYYQRLDLESPSKSLALPEFEALDIGEREARLRQLGVSRAVAKALLATGQRDADRNSVQRDAAATEDAKSLLSAFGKLRDLAAAINKTSQ